MGIGDVLSGQQSWHIEQGNALDVLQSMPGECVQTVITSPPYWSLRDYGTGRWDGGSEECDHKMPRNTNRSNGKQASNTASNVATWPVCGKCGAQRIDTQLGLEPTYQEYVANMVEVFREVWRVLRKDGTLWLNMGDSYVAGPTGHQDISAAHGKAADMFAKGGRYRVDNLRKDIARGYGSLKPKNLVGIPWRVAFALQDDGWILRCDIIWNKPAAMPESAKDRPTRAHEYIFLFTKQARYYYDADAIREPLAAHTHTTYGSVRKPVGTDTLVKSHNWHGSQPTRRQPRRDQDGQIAGANKRSVWSVGRSNFSEAHFATYPPKLIEPCILAGSREADVVLDPFSGAGTTGLVALKHARRYVGIEISAEYIAMSERRIVGDAPLFNSLLEG